jgi:hypothetical protein
MTLNIKQLLGDIYRDIYRRKQDYIINVFLCGAKAGKKDSIRDLLYNEIKDDPRYNVVFPEWLFSDLLATHQFNLFALEHELASNVDVIVLPLEGFGTAAELGAFASSRELNHKIVLINKKEFRHDHSFITLGPVKLIAAERKENVIYYDENNLDELKKRTIARIKHLRKAEPKADVNNLFNLSRFILYIIAIMQPVRREMLQEYLQRYLEDITTHFIAPSLQILLEKGKIRLDIIGAEDYYVLSKKGHRYVYEELLLELDVIKKFSQIRARVINSTLRRKNKLSLDKERDHFLEMQG